MIHAEIVQNGGSFHSPSLPVSICGRLGALKILNLQQFSAKPWNYVAEQGPRLNLDSVVFIVDSSRIPINMYK